MTAVRCRPAWSAAGALLAVAVASCNSGPTQVALPPLEVLIASGDAQFGIVGEVLGAPLRVVVRSANTGSPREDVSVLWDITEGAASVIGVTTTLTDSTGSTEARIRLGSTPGEISVRATVSGQSSATANFRVFGVNQPSLEQIEPTSAVAGGTVVLSGTDFSAVAEQNVVLFSGVRGRVLSATTTSLVVEVPSCLPARSVDVWVQLGVVPSLLTVPLTVTASGPVTSMNVGDVIDVADDGGFPCYSLSGGGGARYLAMAYSASSVGAAQHPYELTVLSSKAAAPTPAAAVAAAAAAPAPTRGGPDAQAGWDQRLREWEAQLVSPGAARAGGSGAAQVEAAAVTTLGERRTFQVLNSSGGFDKVSAVARHIGEKAAVFVDEAAPAGGFTLGDLSELAGRFDQVIHPTDTGAFGEESDLDANERVVILFTPAVNRLTPRGSSGFVGGFFYGVDLLPEMVGSNGGEVFYALVPDPTGQFSDRHGTQEVLQAVPAVLAHEFQHMIHFYQRVLVLGASGQEALWLSEGLAQMAEELVARAYAAQQDAKSIELFRMGARQRAVSYLLRPDTVSVVVGVGQGSLAERGAGFLHVLYLADQEGNDVLGRLTHTTRTGVANVEAETGRTWSALLADWWSAIYLDGPGPEAGPLTYPTVDLRAFLGSAFPLSPGQVGPGDDVASGSLLSSSVHYYLVVPPLTGTVAVRLGGEEGGPSPAQSALRLRIVRVS